jgi:type III restriction enzyme
VARYKQYDEAGQAFNGEYAEMFEEEYRDIVGNMQREFGDDDWVAYLDGIASESTHAGYFSIDKKSRRMVDSKLGDKKERTSDDADAYDLIMKNQERLLDRREPVRFIFSHSALREGWDNPNVFQICTLKQSGSDVRKRQEVGRGLRLSVNQNGERMDTGLLGEDVHNINVLTVIANESYDSFAKGLQAELAEAVADRPRMVTVDLFKNKVIRDGSGAEQVVDIELAQSIYEGLITGGYVKKGALTDKYYEDKKNGTVELAEEVADCRESVIAIIDSIYDAHSAQPDNARKNNVQLAFDQKKFDSAEFKSLWSRISAKSAYVVDFDESELVKKAIDALNRELRVSKIFFKVEKGQLAGIESRQQLQGGAAFTQEENASFSVSVSASASVKYDLVGKVVAETGLTRHAVATILRGIQKSVFEQFAGNPEEFIIKAADIINEQTATVLIQHITYDRLEAAYGSSVFTEPTLKGQLGVNAMTANKHLYDHIVYDSTNERTFAEKVDTSAEVAVYVKLPSGFYISTPVGKYNPDWAIAFHEGKVKHIYFVAETKGSMSSMQLRLVEEAKIHCAREHFKAISAGTVVYDVVDSYAALLDKVMK